VEFGRCCRHYLRCITGERRIKASTCRLRCSSMLTGHETVSQRRKPTNPSRTKSPVHHRTPDPSVLFTSCKPRETSLSCTIYSLHVSTGYLQRRSNLAQERCRCRYIQVGFLVSVSITGKFRPGGFRPTENEYILGDSV